MEKDKKEILEQIVFSIAYDDRKGMIQTIIDFSADEFESKKDYIHLAKSSKKVLRITLNSIFKYYLEN
jgi:hypothetical protein